MMDLIACDILTYMIAAICLFKKKKSKKLIILRFESFLDDLNKTAINFFFFFLLNEFKV